jgi:hypothetical protein
MLTLAIAEASRQARVDKNNCGENTSYYAAYLCDRRG